MHISLKKHDDRPRILWRYSLKEPEGEMECRMKNTPLEFFICNQVDVCPFQCMQKIEQRQRQDYVNEQQLKMLIRIEHITTNGNHNKKI